MFPDLSYIMHALLGTAPDNMFSVVQTFGLFLALAFLCSAYFLKLELSRKYQEGVIGKLKHSSSGYLDDFINSVLLMLISSKALYAAFNFDEVSGHMGDFLLSKKGYWAAGLILAGVLVVWQYFREKKSEKKDTVTYVNPTLKVTDITMAAALFGILGAKIFAIFESADTLKHFMNDPIGSFFSGSGLAIYGGLIIAFFGVNFYVKSIGLKPVHMMDAVAPALVVGYGVGRIGCQLSGDGDWGIVAAAKPSSLSWVPDWLWSTNFPHNVIDEGVPIEGCTWAHCSQLAEAVYPTPLYEVILSAIIFLILWNLRKKISIPGLLFYIYMMLISVERFFIEKIRVNDKIQGFGMEFTQAELISVIVFILGLSLAIYTYFGNKKKLA